MNGGALICILCVFHFFGKFSFSYFWMVFALLYYEWKATKVRERERA